MHFTYSICAYVCEREKEGGRERKRKKKILGNRIIGYRLLFLHFYPHKFYPHKYLSS